MDSNILTPISKRKSEFAFNKQLISESDISLLFEAARWAPSSYNEQPWRFFYVTRENDEKFNSFLSCLVPGNRDWAANASLLVVSAAKKNLTVNGKENVYAVHDTGMATANLLIQAQSLGIATHPMGGYDKKALANLINLPEGFDLLTVIAAGYLGDNAELSETLQKRANAARVRKSVNEIASKL
jgi:nitroreductase